MAPPVTIRVRAAELAGRLAQRGHRWELCVPLHRAVAPGERVTLEVGFGALADELVTQATVLGPAEGAEPARGLRLAIDDFDHGAVLDQLVRGVRTHHVRATRRLPSRLPVRWARERDVGGPAEQSQLADISVHGAFVRTASAVPDVGTPIRLTLLADDGPIELRSVVTWVDCRRRRSGFGVLFKARDRQTAFALRDLVRAHDGPCPP